MFWARNQGNEGGKDRGLATESIIVNTIKEHWKGRRHKAEKEVVCVKSNEQGVLQMLLDYIQLRSALAWQTIRSEGSSSPATSEAPQVPQSCIKRPVPICVCLHR